MRQVRLIVAGLFLLIVSATFSQNDSVEVKPYKESSMVFEDFKDYYKSIGHIYTRPIHWKKKEWLTFGGVVGGTVLLSFLDKPIYNFYKDRESNFGNSIASIGDYGGKPIPGYAIATGLYLTGAAFKKPKLRRAAIMTFVAISSAGFFQTLTKGSTGRARPSAEKGNWHFKPFEFTYDYHSFPSGHTIVAMSTSFALAKSTDIKALKVAFYSWGAITAWSRLYEGAHWFTDVALSTAISWFTVETTAKFLEARDKKRKEAREMRGTTGATFQLTPTLTGLSMSLTW